LLLQVHFVNASAQDIDARADVTFSTVTQGISTQAGVFFYEDPFIDIPAGAAGQASMRCIVPNDITILSVSSYGHARLQNLSAYIDAPSNPPAARPFFTSLGAANPLPIQASIPISAGSHVRVACAYQNEQGASDIFEGLDYRGDEMCVLSGTYYPVMSVAAESCALTPDEFGTGTSTCSQALACAVACPSATTPPADFGLLGTPQVDPCWQKCVAASCSATSALLFALERCSQANCSTACAAPASADCTTCQAAMCPSETSGCASDICGG